MRLTSIYSILFSVFFLSSIQQVSAKKAVEDQHPDAPVFEEVTNVEYKQQLNKDVLIDWDVYNFENEWTCSLLFEDIQAINKVKELEKNSLNAKTTQATIVSPQAQGPQKGKQTLTEAIWIIEEVGLGATY